ncbi:MAG TPA: efflux transporter outer membrane subunit, partial [Moraxellaceae bacterium]|nr:efflux transporter outer membrane subunit [Moraxellaceae bacterium]
MKSTRTTAALNETPWGHSRRAIAVAILAASLGACAVGPEYVRPKVDMPAQFAADAGWQPARPRDGEPRGKWWEVYGDTSLNALMDKVQVDNLNVRQAEARYRQASALAQEARAGFFPVVSASAGTSQQHSSSLNTVTGTRVASHSTTSSLSLGASWMPDLWGRIRRSVEAGDASAEASRAELAAALLSAQAELAQDYFQLRVVDAQSALYERSVADYQRSLQITQNQFAVGIGTRADVARAETQLLTTQAQAVDLGVQRTQLEHAIALLIGATPGQFQLPPAPLPAALPAVPDGVPSDLLERRPDIAAAERQVAAANASIGVARSAYFPALTLSGSGGLEAARLADLFDSPTRVWSVGAALAGTLFDGGLRAAQSDAAVAAYDAQVAAYRQTVLGSLQEVEDNLSTLRLLEQEAEVQDRAVQASEEATTLAFNQYKAGTASYLAVVTAQATALGNERTRLQI